MTDSERIAALEQELALTRHQLKLVGSLLTHHLGVSAAFHGVVLTLLESHHASDLIRPKIVNLLAQLDAEAIALAENEEYPQGLHVAQQRIESALSPQAAATDHIAYSAAPTD